MIRARILGTGSALGRRTVTTAALAARALPHRDPEEMARRVAIHTRTWVDDEGAAALATDALRRALDAAGVDAAALRRIILTTSTGGDHLIPATAHAVAGALGVDGDVDCFDVNNSCVGFLTAFDLAAMTVASGRGPVAVVAVEVFSRYVTPERPRPFLVLGDAAAAVVLGATDADEGLVASVHRTHTDLRDRLVTPHPGVVGHVEAIDFTPPAPEMTRSAVTGMRACVEPALARAGLALGDVDWFLPHQPNGHMLAEVTRAFGVDPARMVPVVEEVGSVGAAAIPTSLDRLWRTGRVKPGHHVLLTGVGSGTAAAALLYRVAA